jgi:hypothetical protein
LHRTISVFLNVPGSFTGTELRLSEWLLWQGSSPLALERLKVAPEAEVLIEGKKGQFGDLRYGMRLALQLAADQPTITRLSARRPAAEIVLRKVDAERRVLAVVFRDRNVAVEELVVAPTAVIRFDSKEVTLADLKPGMALHLSLGLGDGNRLVVLSIDAGKLLSE